MAGLPSPSPAAGSRARRWDAVVLGSSLPALVAAARIGAAGHRVLVVEEDAAARAHPALREPFLLQGAGRGGVLDACLRELGVPLIDRRRIEIDAIACQVVSPERRVDVGEARLTADEWVAWGLDKPEAALARVRALGAAAEARAAALLEAPVVRLGRRLVTPRPAGPTGERPAPPTAAAVPVESDAPASGPLAAHLRALVRALSSLAGGEPAPEDRARLLGELLGGGARFASAPPWLHGLLRRRVEVLYGEFRSATGAFRLVDAGGDAGIELAGGDLWVGRALVLGSPAGLAGRLPASERPAFLPEEPAPARRLRLLYEVDRRALPEGMADRVVLLDDEDGPSAGDRAVTVAIFPGAGGRAALVATALRSSGSDPAHGAAEVEARLRRLMPFAGESLRLQARPLPTWDDEDLLCEPAPAEVDLRLSARPRVYGLDRAGVAGLGLEGDLLLGWRGGDAVAAELG